MKMFNFMGEKHHLCTESDEQELKMEKIENLVVVISSRYDNRINVIGPFNFLPEAQNFVVFSANEDKKELGETLVEFMDDDYYMETAKTCFYITELRELS